MANQALPFAVLLAIPASADAYQAAAQREPLSDYMQHLLAGATPQQVWDERYARIVAAATQLVEELDALGVPVISEATLTDVANYSRQAQTLVLFAHWVQLPGTNERTGRPNGALELGEGLADAEALHTALPPDFVGTLDLCCCHSVVPAAQLKLWRGDALRIVHGTQALDPLPALVIVRHLIGLCLRGGADYRLARLQTAAALARQ